MPPRVLGFIQSSIDAVEQLHVLLLLFEASPAARTVEQICRELRSTPASVRKRLHDLVSRKVLAPEAVTADNEASFLTATPEVSELVRELSELYRLRPHRVIAQIFAQPPPALRSFSDAFVLKKDKD